MTKSADISRIGQIDLLVGQAQFNTTGAGELNSVQVPATLPGKNRFFLVETATLIVEDINVVPSQSFPYPTTGFTTAQIALAFIVAAGVQPGSQNTLFAITSPSPSQCGPSVDFPWRGAMNNNQGFSSIYTMQTSRKVIIPQGQALRIYIQDPGDGSAHAVTATLLVQGRWFDAVECEC